MVKIKTTREWEASDVDYNDPIHKFLRSLIAFITLDMVLIRRDELLKSEDKDGAMKPIVADILNLLENEHEVALVLKEPSAEQREVKAKVDCSCRGQKYGFHNNGCPNAEARPFA